MEAKKRREQNTKRVGEAFRAKEWSPTAGNPRVDLVPKVKPGHAGTLYNQEEDK
jgi:hypothetical protein